MGARVPRRRSNIPQSRRVLLFIGLLVAGVAMVVLALLFARPAGEGMPEEQGGPLTLGPVEDFAMGSVTEAPEGELWLVRVGEEEFLALSWRDPHMGCRVPWNEDFVWPDQETGVETAGWFRNPCHGETYDKLGRRAFGPSPRDLDRYVVSIVDDEVVVDTSRYVCGWSPPGAACVEPLPVVVP